MIKIGHRGAKGYEPENTIASFQKAIDLECDGIELDVHLSSDKKTMVIHDETIDRTTIGNGLVNSFSSDELNKLGVPTLEEVLHLVNKKCFINIEIKDSLATKSVLNLIQNYILDKDWNSDLFQISSFNWEVLNFCHSEERRVSLGVLTENNIDDALVFAKKINAYSINPYFKLLNSDNVILMQQNGFKVFPWTVNSQEDLTFVKSLGVDGIISDFPDRI